MKPTIKELKTLFDKVNQDCLKSGELVVDLTNVEFYSDQIENIYEIDPETAHSLAEELAKTKK